MNEIISNWVSFYFWIVQDNETFTLMSREKKGYKRKPITKECAEYVIERLNLNKVEGLEKGQYTWE